MEHTETDFLKRSHIIIMAICTGLIVANIYYCQPLLVLISKSFNIPESKGGRITFLTQAGYALGLLFFVPLGDKLERRKQIVWMAAFAVGSLILAALSPNFLSLEIACVLIGATSVIPQLILPLAAQLASPTRTGKVIGSIMSGLLVGILLSRTLSGFVGAWLGWRGMYWVAAGISFLLLLVMRYTFPASRPHFSGSYASLMRTLLKLIKEQPVLREAAVINALGFATFGMFWTTLTFHLSGAPFHYTSDIIGLFGLAAAAGALAARNRLNTVYMTVSFAGTSLGSALGVAAWDKARWTGVCIAGMVLTLLAFTIYGFTYKKAASRTLSDLAR